MLHPALVLGGTQALPTRRESLEYRLLALLRTTPGDLPWRPDFGCDLQRFVGKPLAPGMEGEIQWLVQEAIAGWLPDLQVTDVAVQVTVLHRPDRMQGHAGLPVGRALLFLGTQVGVRIRMKVRDTHGTTTVELDPFA